MLDTYSFQRGLRAVSFDVSFRRFDDRVAAATPAPTGPPRIWDTGHELGSLGRWDLWCIDFMYDANLEMRMLEMTDSCLFKVAHRTPPSYCSHPFALPSCPLSPQ